TRCQEPAVILGSHAHPRKALEGSDRRLHGRVPANTLQVIGHGLGGFHEQTLHRAIPIADRPGKGRRADIREPCRLEDGTSRRRERNAEPKSICTHVVVSLSEGGKQTEAAACRTSDAVAPQSRAAA